MNLLICIMSLVPCSFPHKITYKLHALGLQLTIIFTFHSVLKHLKTADHHFLEPKGLSSNCFFYLKSLHIYFQSKKKKNRTEEARNSKCLKM